MEHQLIPFMKKYLPLLAIVVIYPYLLDTFFGLYAFILAVIVIIGLTVHLLRKMGFADILKPRNCSYKDILKVVLGFLGLLLWAMFVYHFFPRTANQQMLDSLEYVGVSLVLFNGYVGLIGPIGEELVFRGLVMKTLSSASFPYVDVIVSASLFSLGHVLPHGWSWYDFVAYGVMGMIYALVFKKSKTIYPSIILHVIWNSFPFLF